MTEVHSVVQGCHNGTACLGSLCATLAVWPEKYAGHSK